MPRLSRPDNSRTAAESLNAALGAIVGRRHVITEGRQLVRYAKGYRTGGGVCLAAVRPGTLVEMWRVLKACVEADVVIIIQGANTGLTGGSTPSDEYDRDVVIISTLRISGVRPIRDGTQVVCLAGATLHELENALRPLGREPHSVIGSSCIGASVVGGVCNNSGGALVRRGPAYTEFALYARLTGDGELELVNHLGIELGDAPEAMLAALEHNGAPLRVSEVTGRASDCDYQSYVRDIDAPSPARFNADPRRLHEASGCAGKLAVFAVRLDTFPRDDDTATFYIGTNAALDLTSLRRQILSAPHGLPVAGEYLHRDAFDIAARYGKDAYLAVRLLGADQLPLLQRLKTALDALAVRLRLPRNFGDRVLQALGTLAQQHLPRRLREFRDLYEHHLILKVSAEDKGAIRRLLQTLPSKTCGWFECAKRESESAFLHRFVVAGAAVRYRALHAESVEDMVALDFALPRNALEWTETLPPAIEQRLLVKLYYGHFFCHVFHHDYLVAKGCDPIALEHELCALLDERGAEYPAEHNVGHLYRAKPALERHYRTLDPLNAFNPGIGQLSKRRRWRDAIVRGDTHDRQSI